jgi:hypothetical protein
MDLKMVKGGVFHRKMTENGLKMGEKSQKEEKKTQRKKIAKKNRKKKKFTYVTSLNTS